MKDRLKIEFNPSWGKKGLKIWLLRYLVMLCTVIIFLNLIYPQDSILSSKSISFLAIENYGVHIPVIPDYFKKIIIPIYFILGIVWFFKTIGLLLYIGVAALVWFFKTIGLLLYIGLAALNKIVAKR
ncbi:hypothetical protein ACQVVA_23895 [Bacillus paranthracis]|uniref:hypothetical protein n=1 Tax=Bacillus paranthracis TaxID=2026186 RepID=UPI003D64BF0E